MTALCPHGMACMNPKKGILDLDACTWPLLKKRYEHDSGLEDEVMTLAFTPRAAYTEYREGFKRCSCLREG